MCLGYRDAHGYASLLSKWQHRRQSWEKGSLQIPKCWCAMCSRNRKPSADGNRELPNSANKSPVEKAVDRKRRGCSLQTAGAMHPLQWLSPHVWAGRGRHWVEEGSQGGMGTSTSAAIPKPASWDLRVALGWGWRWGESPVDPWGEQRGRRGDCVVSLSLAPSHRQPGWPWEFRDER